MVVREGGARNLGSAIGVDVLGCFPCAFAWWDVSRDLVVHAEDVSMCCDPLLALVVGKPPSYCHFPKRCCLKDFPRASRNAREANSSGNGPYLC